MLKLLLGLGSLSLGVHLVDAEPNFPNFVPNAVKVVVNGETWRFLGHASVNAASSSAGSANPFGKAFLAASGNLNTAWATICSQDSDGDGFTNGEELCDPTCVWTPGDADPTDCVVDLGSKPLHPGFAEGAVIDAGTSEAFLKLHATCMIIAWAIFAPIGIMGATLFKKAGPPPTWFKVHRLLLTSASVLTLLGFMFMIIYVGGLAIVDTHSKLGICVVILAVIQPLSGFFRAHLPKPGSGEPKTTIRYAWEFQHQWTGRTIVILAVGALATGFQVGFGGDIAKPGGFVLVSVLLVAGVFSFIYVFCYREPKAEAKAKQKVSAAPSEAARQRSIVSKERTAAQTSPIAPRQSKPAIKAVVVDDFPSRTSKAASPTAPSSKTSEAGSVRDFNSFQV